MSRKLFSERFGEFRVNRYQLLIDPGYSSFEISDSLPETLQKLRIPGTHPLLLSGDFGQILFQEFRQEGERPFIRYDRYLVQQEGAYHFHHPQGEIRLQFILQNHFAQEIAGIGRWPVSEGTYNLFFVPSLESQLLLKSGQDYATLNIYLRYEDLDRLGLESYSPLLENFLRSVREGRAARLHAVNQPTNFVMEQIINQLYSSHKTGPLQGFFLANKVSELLISSFDPRNQPGSISHYNQEEEELQKLLAARQVWLEDLQAPGSLTLLARKTGLNINKLSAGFKEVFGHSPYGLLLNARMALAARLLMDTSLTIADISDRVGYGGIQSFSKAFKLYYKESPLQYRKINSTRLDKK